jgi:hypothetical protein
VSVPFGEGESGVDFLGLEVKEVLVELLLEVEEDVVDLLGVGVALGAFLLVDLEESEFLKLVLLEDVAVHRQAVGNLVDLGELRGLVGEVTTKMIG